MKHPSYHERRGKGCYGEMWANTVFEECSVFKNSFSGGCLATMSYNQLTVPVPFTWRYKWPWIRYASRGISTKTKE